MLASVRWLSELTGLSLQAEEVAERLTAVGLEVEGVTRFGHGLEQVVVAEVIGKQPHPKRDKLQLVTVTDGRAEQVIVCGANNVPDAGGRVVLARLGATLPNGMEIAERELGGVRSCGMLCGETELGIGFDDGGLLLLDPDPAAPAGTALADALELADTVLEIGLTPNRPDCLGHVGIARELGVIYGRPALGGVECPLPSEVAGGNWPGLDGAYPLFGTSVAPDTPRSDARSIPDFSLTVADADKCPRYGAALIDGIQVGRSPFWLRYRLYVLGQRAISNVVDATNLVLLGHGHPIHAFDFDRLDGPRVEVRCADAGEAIVTLDGERRALERDDLLICDAAGPIALAGIMGGANTEVSAGSTRVLVECAYFQPQSIRRTSKRVGLHTDASHRFERGVDPNAIRSVLAYAAALIQQLAGGRVCETAVEVAPGNTDPVRIQLRAARMQAVLGFSVEPEEARTTLRGLGCQVAGTADCLDVVAPTHRPDLLREIDLIEEVARIAGYGRIPTVIPPTRPSEEGTSESIRFIRRLRESAASQLNEAVNFAFVSPRDLEAAGLPVSPVMLANPMSEDRCVLRTGLLAGLSANLRAAQRHQQDRLAHFEVARVFASGEGGPLPEERYQLGIMMWGERADTYREGLPMDFYDLKGAVEAVVAGVGSRAVDWRVDDGLDTDAAYLHPRRRARVFVAGVAVGEAGELHPSVVEDLGLNGRPLYAQFDVLALQLAIEAAGYPQGRPLPRFPAAVRDIAVSVPLAVPTGEVGRVLAEAGGALVEGVQLFDIYTGAPVPEGDKSVAFHVVYRDPDATLTDKKVDKTHARLTRAAEERFGATVRK